MSLDLTPPRVDWVAVTQGDTFPAQTITEDSDSTGDTALVRVRIKVKSKDLATTHLTLDSDATGITINTATAGAWSYTIDEIDTTAIPVGFHTYDLETTDDAGTVRTECTGEWPILPQVTD